MPTFAFTKCCDTPAESDDPNLCSRQGTRVESVCQRGKACQSGASCNDGHACTTGEADGLCRGTPIAPAPWRSRVKKPARLATQQRAFANLYPILRTRPRVTSIKTFAPRTVVTAMALVRSWKTRPKERRAMTGNSARVRTPATATAYATIAATLVWTEASAIRCATKPTTTASILPARRAVTTGRCAQTTPVTVEAPACIRYCPCKRAPKAMCC
ncbi:hypothetical protein HRbin30_03225 [bacterium HR30]|nr:hypothetical protein HRbin30_03225 [bacterium HR30]